MARYVYTTFRPLGLHQVCEVCACIHSHKNVDKYVTIIIKLVCMYTPRIYTLDED